MRNLYRRAILWAFDRLYYELAWCYDLVAAAVSGGYWPHWIRGAVAFLRGGRVLELGCGTGHLQQALGRAGISHIGYDRSRPMLRQARRRLRRSGLPLRLLQGRAQALPFASGSFTDVVATFPAPYIVDPATLSEIRRVLAPGGQLVIVDGGRLRGRGLYPAAVGALVRATEGPGEHRYGEPLIRGGFAPSTHEVEVGRSSVIVVVAVAENRW